MSDTDLFLLTVFTHFWSVQHILRMGLLRSVNREFGNRRMPTSALGKGQWQVVGFLASTFVLF